MVMKHKLNTFYKYLRVSKKSDKTIYKPFQLKYTFIPILLGVSYLFFNADTTIENHIKHSMPQGITYYFGIITHFGLALYILICLGVMIAVLALVRNLDLSQNLKYRIAALNNYTWFLIATITISSVIGQVLKFVIGRGRPKFFLEYGSYHFHYLSKPSYDFASMPSGHSITAAAFFTGLIYLVPKFRVLWVVCAIAIALSRIVLGFHYPSDVVLGLAIGFYTTVFVYYWMKNRDLL